jgi:hypothetical protein
MIRVMISIPRMTLGESAGLGFALIGFAVWYYLIRKKKTHRIPAAVHIR